MRKEIWKELQSDKTSKKIAIGFTLILILMAMIAYFNSVSIKKEAESKQVIYENVDPVEFVEIQGENVRLADVEGYIIDEWNRAGGGYIYVLRFYGVAYEFDFNTHAEAQDVGDYICMLKGERL